MPIRLKVLVGIAFASALSASACSPIVAAVPNTATPTLTAVPTPGQRRIWIAPTVPDDLRLKVESSGIPLAQDPSMAASVFTDVASDQPGTIPWIYALAAPFPTVLDGISATDLGDFWKGDANREYTSWPLWMSASTYELLQSQWGAPGIEVHTTDSTKVLDAAWQTLPSWAIVPFEALEPRWKVLAVDGASPVHKDFDPSSYPLRFNFGVTGDSADDLVASLPRGNRDPSRLSTVLMTGTSALVREIAYQMEVKGITYPAGDVGDWLRQADILHISHETSFDPTCPPPNPLKTRFYCSSPTYIGLFDDVGVDIVELTGNHTLDNGAGSFLYTLDLYRDHGIRYFGGGADIQEARQPLLLEDHGNKIAFLGCNFAEPPQPLATDRSPGANPCYWPLLEEQIDSVKRDGYVPIVTMQYKEGYSPIVMPWQSIDFRRPAAAGAAIVSGSQSHVPLQMEFFEGAFVHYGLGNLFFGQMANQPPGPGLPIQPAVRYEFLDRHVIYAGRYISTELLTAMLEDYARPRPMSTPERTAILQSYFAYSGWLPLIPTPAPAHTPTPYPLLKFIPLPTYTPLPTATPGS